MVAWGESANPRWQELGRIWVLLLTLISCMACTGPSSDVPEEPRAPVASAASPSPEASSSPDAPGPLVVFLGDSLTAGYGLDKEFAFPAVLGELLAAEGQPIRVVNAGVSGDTTAGGRSRLDWLLRQKPDVLMVSLGGNDGLRALDLAMTENNLREIITLAQDAGVRVLLAGMLVPPNYGPDYGKGFQAIYPRLAEDSGVALIPFLLEGVAGVAEFNQSDGIHPTAEGQRRVAEVVLPYLKAALAEVDAAVIKESPQDS